MTVSEQWLGANGYAVEDTSAKSPFDFKATNDAQCVKVEVKGTTAGSIDSLFMTKNEVELHRQEKGQTALLLVSAIELTSEDGLPVARGGILTPLVGWDIDEWDATPMAFQLKRKALG